MPAVKVDHLIEQGADYSFSLVVKKGSPPEPMNLSGYLARMQIRSDVRSATVILNLSSEDGGITIDADLGRINFLIDANTTRGFAFSQAVYDILLVSPADYVTRLAEGVFKLSPGVTRD